MAHTFALEAQAAWRILVIGIVLGAGLPALFAVGVRAMAFGHGGDAEAAGGTGASSGPHPLGRLIGVACFAVVLLVVVLGIVYIVATGFGKVLSFEHVYPTITSKS